MNRRDALLAAIGALSALPFLSFRPIGAEFAFGLAHGPVTPNGSCPAKSTGKGMEHAKMLSSAFEWFGGPRGGSLGWKYIIGGGQLHVDF